MARTKGQLISPIGILTATGVNVFGNINVTGIITASNFSGNASSASYASVAGVATYATASGVSTNVIGGIGSITQLNVSGVTSFTSIVETQSTPSITNKTLFLNALNGTVFAHTTSSNIGIVSFSGISTAKAGTQTFTVLVTQGSTPFNTIPQTGIGTALATVVISPGNVGYSTHIKVGGGSTIILTNTAGALDILTFIVSYDGATSIANTSFKVVGFAATDFYGVVN
jgi:hypothetical protein